MSEPSLRVQCADCGTGYSLHTHTVCPHCFSRDYWTKGEDRDCTCVTKPLSSANAMHLRAFDVSESKDCPVHGVKSDPNPFNYPLCPDCGGVLNRVTNPGDSMLNDYQFDAVRAGDWYCEHCKGSRAKSGFRYFWNRELTGVKP